MKPTKPDHLLNAVKGKIEMAQRAPEKAAEGPPSHRIGVGMEAQHQGGLPVAASKGLSI
jgi:hypothetical protein